MSRGGVLQPPPPSFDAARDLATVGAQVRAEWRADEEMWMREAARRWAHGRRIADLLREYAARGDRVAVDVAGCTFVGEVGAIGDDRVDVVAAAGIVTIHTALAEAFGAVAAPLMIRRSHRARTGGRRTPPALVTFGGRLRELELSARPVRVGTFLAGGELLGAVVLGADHVTVHAATEVVVPLAWVAYVAEASEVVW